MSLLSKMEGRFEITIYRDANVQESNWFQDGKFLFHLVGTKTA